MQPPLDAAELAELYPHLEPWQRQELEAWHRSRNHARMCGDPIPNEPPPWPETPNAHPHA